MTAFSLRRRCDRGQATPMVAMVLVAAGLLLVAVASLGRVIINRASAQTAADAAVLAGGRSGELEARAIAAANGAKLVEYRQIGSVFEVTVIVGDRQATARAKVTSIPGRGSRAGLDPRLLAALDRAERLLGTPIPVVSGLRTRARQQELWNNRATNPYPVASPGTSDHESGRAVDVARTFVPSLLFVAGQVGLCQPLPSTDPVHFVLC